MQNSRPKPIAGLSFRIALPAILTILLFAVATLLFFLPAIEDSHMARKREMILELTESAWSLLEMSEGQVRDGLLSREAAQDFAIAQIRALRYGPERKDYFWIMDKHPRMIMHPYRPDLEGHDLSDYSDSSGKKIFTECVRLVRESGAGYIDYEWQWKDDPAKLSPKLSYIKGFEPWGWIMGSGIYIDDVHAEIVNLKRYILSLSAGIFVIIFCLTLYMIRQAVLSERIRRQTESALRTSEKRCKEFADSLPQFVFETDRQGNLTFANHFLLDNLGFVQTDIAQGIQIFLALVPEDRERAMANFKRVLHGEQLGNVEYTAQTKEGRTLSVLIHTDRILQNSKPAGIRGIAIDTTAQKAFQAEKEKLERQIRQTMKMETIGTLAGGIAHDFNNILAAIIGYADLAIETIPVEDQNRYNVEQILSAGNRARDLVKQILTFSRQTEQEKHPLRLELLLKETVRFLRASLPASILIKTEIAVKNDLVFGDSTQLHQVLMNLCTNSSHAMREKGGQIHIFLTEESPNAPDLADESGAPSGKYLKLQVKDTGSGIHSEILDRIFDPFFTTKKREEGTGLGLSVVHGIIKDHHGFISVASQPGEGTTVDIFLPMHQGVMEKPVNTDILQLKGSERLLFVDDEEMIVQMSEKQFKRLGYDVVVTTESLEAIELFQKDPDRFDIIITDLTMPNLTGLELASRALQIRPDIPIILCTGFGDQTSREKAMALGIVDIILKPPLTKDLARAVRKALDKKDPSRT